MKFLLVSAMATALASAGLDDVSALQVAIGDLTKGKTEAPKKRKKGVLAGTADLQGYQKHVKAFVGLNPRHGEGSGFVVKDIKKEEFGIVPSSNTGRNDLCTCDCKAGADGIGCNGYGGIRFRYNSMLWTDPVSGAWNGQMEAWQPGKESSTGAFGPEFHFLGQDQRIYPGGPAVYSIACTAGDCGVFSGTFRQANGPVSCKAALEEDEEAVSTTGTDTLGNEVILPASTCFDRCVNKAGSNLYKEWLEYCKADHEDSKSGFRGYDQAAAKAYRSKEA